MFKLAKFLSIVCLILLFIFVLQNQVLAIGEFSRTCRDIQLTDDVGLEATCRTINGQNSQTGLNLNHHIINRNGQLRWRRNGNYIDSCHSCDVTTFGGGGSIRTILDCQCQRIDRSWVSAQLNLDERIANINGQLRYERPPREGL